MVKAFLPRYWYINSNSRLAKIGGGDVEISGTDKLYIADSFIHDNGTNFILDAQNVLQLNPTTELTLYTGGTIRQRVNSVRMKHYVGVDDSVEDVDSATATLGGKRTYSVSYTTTGAVTLTLPDLTSSDIGRRYTICDTAGNAGTNNITVNRASTDTINGGTSAVISANYGSLTLVYAQDGKWVIVE